MSSHVKAFYAHFQSAYLYVAFRAETRLISGVSEELRTFWRSEAKGCDAVEDRTCLFKEASINQQQAATSMLEEKFAPYQRTDLNEQAKYG
jgi:hypothetical protein